MAHLKTHFFRFDFRGCLDLGKIGWTEKKTGWLSFFPLAKREVFHLRLLDANLTAVSAEGPARSPIQKGKTSPAQGPGPSDWQQGSPGQKNPRYSGAAPPLSAAEKIALRVTSIETTIGTGFCCPELISPNRGRCVFRSRWGKMGELVNPRCLEIAGFRDRGLRNGWVRCPAKGETPIRGPPTRLPTGNTDLAPRLPVRPVGTKRGPNKFPRKETVTAKKKQGQ